MASVSEQKLERPSARLELNGLGRICAEARAPQTVEQIGCRKEREAEDERLDESTHTVCMLAHRVSNILQVHPGIHGRDLITIPVEHQRSGRGEQRWQPPFTALIPADRAHVRVDVGVKAVPRRILLDPRRTWHLVGQANPHDRLRPLEPVLPRHDESNGRAILIEQRLAVQSDREQRQRVHRLVEPQTLPVRPVQPSVGAPGISFGRRTVVNSTKAALPVGSTRFRIDASGTPTHGITIDHASTQRCGRSAPRARRS